MIIHLSSLIRRRRETLMSFSPSYILSERRRHRLSTPTAKPPPLSQLTPSFFFTTRQGSDDLKRDQPPRGKTLKPFLFYLQIIVSFLFFAKKLESPWPSLSSVIITSPPRFALVRPRQGAAPVRSRPSSDDFPYSLRWVPAGQQHSSSGSSGGFDRPRQSGNWLAFFVRVILADQKKDYKKEWERSIIRSNPFFSHCSHSSTWGLYCLNMCVVAEFVSRHCERQYMVFVAHFMQESGRLCDCWCILSQTICCRV